MKYPVFRISQGRTALTNLRSSSKVGNSNVAPEWRTAPGELDQDEIEEIFAELRKALSPKTAEKLQNSGLEADKVEGALALELYEILTQFPAQTLGDPDFWRYVAVEVLNDFIVWRLSDDAALANYGLDSARTIVNCVPSRMFNRAYLAHQIAGSSGEDSVRATATSGGSDFWQSYILRVQNRYDPHLVKSLITGLQRTSRESIRSSAPIIRRARANIILELQGSTDIESTVSAVLDSVADNK